MSERPAGSGSSALRAGKARRRPDYLCPQVGRAGSRLVRRGERPGWRARPPQPGSQTPLPPPCAILRGSAPAAACLGRCVRLRATFFCQSGELHSGPPAPSPAPSRLRPLPPRAGLGASFAAAEERARLSNIEWGRAFRLALSFSCYFKCVNLACPVLCHCLQWHFSLRGKDFFRPYLLLDRLCSWDEAFQCKKNILSLKACLTLDQLYGPKLVQ